MRYSPLRFRPPLVPDLGLASHLPCRRFTYDQQLREPRRSDRTRMKDSIKGMTIRALASRPVSALMAPLLENRASIFMLHRFRDGESGLNGIHDPQMLRACLEELRRARVPVMSLDALVTLAIQGQRIPRGTVSFTMDDGFWDQGEIGAELFLEYDIPVTVFLITGLQDGVLWPWDDRLGYIYEKTEKKRLNLKLAGHSLCQQLGPGPDLRRVAMRETRAIFKTLPFEELEKELAVVAEQAELTIPRAPPEKHRPLGWEAIKKLEQRGVMFGPHTVSHGIVSRMSEETARWELLEGWQQLKARIRSPVNIYGWPTGRDADFGPREIAIVRDAGFRAAVATEDDYAFFPADTSSDAMFSLRRFGLPGSTAEFLKYRSWLERGKQLVSLP